ncbi:MAG: LacI family transcriptional regulator [Dysgonamonadaceae bacterium]|jgi:LacI family transcriptional regulator|nr:LacI family transcriptional regulator [Dysgonamonadaceae bacterium]
MAKQKKVQLQDIASVAGVNISTVSMVLNGRARERRISERLEKKIIKVAKELNYKPNVLAQSLRSGKSFIIGLILPDMANSTFARLGRHIEELAAQEGYRIMICSSGEEDDDPESLINSLIDYQVDGIIIAPTTRMQPSLFKMIEDSGKPYVIVDRYLSYVNTSQVVVDNFSIGFLSTEHLLQQGLRRIAIFSFPPSLQHMEDRVAGYEAAMKKYHVPVINDDLIKLVSYEKVVEETATAIDDILALKPAVEGIIFFTNMIGLPGLEYLYQIKKVVIPRDFKLISMEASPYFSLMNPSITVVNLNIKRMAEKSMELLMQFIKHNIPLETKQYTIPVSLISRESSKKPANP